MKSMKSILCTGLPILGMVVASTASGTNLEVFFASDQVPDGRFVQDCNSGVTHFQAIGAQAEAFDSAGVPVSNHAERCVVATGVEGTTNDTTSRMTCTSTTARKHKVTFFADDSGGSMHEICSGNLTLGWLTDFGSNTNVSQCSVSRNSRYSSGSGWSSCASRSFTAYSGGLN